MRDQNNRQIWPFPAATAWTRDRAVFHGFVVNGNTPVQALASFYGLDISAAHRASVVAEYLREHLHGYPLTGDRVPLGAIALVVLKKSGRAVELAGLDLGEGTAAARVKYFSPHRSQARH
ncbi:MAG: Potassium/proton antiporter, family [Betaproteobacteria bacterium]|nr:Potassium/proton antiporter, family [Betaproteobacteria bacterium]